MKKWQTVALDVLVNALTGWWEKRKEKKAQEKKNVDKTPPPVL